MDAIFHAGFDVPLFCAERYLSPVGACRMCLVRIGTPRKGPDGGWILEDGAPKIFWMPKPQASCVTAVSEGMVVDTLSDEVKHAQSGMVELTLMNHPLDCPTCDKGGACELQDRSYEFGLVEKYYQPDRSELPLYTRFTFTRRHVDKHHPLSPFIILDRERCIHCKRCVRYFEEVPGDEVLDFIERGVHTFISSEEPSTLPSSFSGNITDICPVGALLDLTARFRGRNWEYDQTPSTCTLCSVGCGITVDARSGELERIRAREVPEVNEAWICDAGRFAHEGLMQGRLKRPLLRKGGRLVESSWEEAAQVIRQGLERIGNSELGLYLSGDATLEEGLAALELAEALGTPHRDFAGRTEVPATTFSATFEDLLAASFILLLGDPTEEAPIVHLRLSEWIRGLRPAAPLAHGTPFANLAIKERMPRQREKLAVATPYPIALERWAAFRERLAPGAEAAWLAQLAQGAHPLSERLVPGALLIIGAGILNQPEAARQVAELAEAKRLKVLAMTPAPHARGLELLGLYPKAGGAAWHSPGPKAAFFGYTPSEEQLRSLHFRILHLSQLDPLAERYADVILPAQGPYERRGSFVNLEGRVRLLEPAGIENGEADGAVAALAVLAEAAGLTPPIRLLRQAQRLLKERYGLPSEGALWEGRRAQWPAQGEEGNVYLRPSMWKRPHLRGAAVAKVASVELWLHPQMAQSLGLTPGAEVELELPEGPQKTKVRLDETLAPGWLFAPALGVWAGRRWPLRVLAGGRA
jgi:NADH-quinone oxidoreductase subunit G